MSDVDTIPSVDGRARIPGRNGGFLTPWPKGISGHQGAPKRGLKEIRELARHKSVESVESLGYIIRAFNAQFKPDDGIQAQDIDGRIVVVAAQTILTWAYGKPPDYDPKTEGPELPVDLSKLTHDDLKALQAIMARATGVTVVDAEPVAEAPSVQPDT